MTLLTFVCKPSILRGPCPQWFESVDHKKSGGWPVGQLRGQVQQGPHFFMQKLQSWNAMESQSWRGAEEGRQNSLGGATYGYISTFLFEMWSLRNCWWFLICFDGWFWHIVSEYCLKKLSGPPNPQIDRFPFVVENEVCKIRLKFES